MKLMPYQEFEDRVQALQRARRIFGELTGNNITKAFEAYQEILAETERPAQLTTAEHGSRAPTIVDAYGRPKCPDCGSDMFIRRVPPNPEDIKAQLVCENEDCDLVLDSMMTLEAIVQELKENAEARSKENAGSE